MHGGSLVVKNGHRTGTARAETIDKADVVKPAKDIKSVALAFVPRLLDLKASAHYLSIGVWTVRELVWAGKLPVVRLPRADNSGDMRLILIDRNDLDAFIAGLPKEYEPN